MATYQGRFGKVTRAGATVGQVTQWSAQAPRDKVEKRVLGQKSKTYELGQIDFGARVTVEFDKGDSAQSAMLDDCLADNPAAAAYELCVDASGTKKFSISARPILLSIGAERQNNISAEFELVPAGDLTVDWS